jgi:hypothetical protein
MTNLNYAVEVFEKKAWEENDELRQVAFITTEEQFRKFLLEIEAEHYNDEIIDGITHMYYMV